MTYALTPRQAECLYIIAQAIEVDGVAPSLSEIAVRLGYQATSKGAVCSLLRHLEARGHIRRRRRGARAIELISPVQVTDAAIAEMDAFAQAWSEGKVGGRNDYWHALDRILRANALSIRGASQRDEEVRA